MMNHKLDFAPLLASLERIEAHLDRIDNALEKRGTPTRTCTDEPPASPQPVKQLMCNAAAEYLKQKRQEVTPQHFQNISNVMAAFRYYHGTPVYLGNVRPKHVVAYRDHLLGRGRQKETANQHIAILSGFFSWCVQPMAWIERNPTLRTKFRLQRHAQGERKAFTKEQLAVVFSKNFLVAARPQTRPAHYWLPLVMLYTGARPEEVAQLRAKDVWWIGDRRIFDFATIEEGQRRKSEASRRVVPIHPKLVELGIMGYAAAQREGPLFPELNPGANGRLAEAPSRWFNRRWLRGPCGITDTGLVLYSLRHTVATQLKVEHGVEEAKIAQLLGHSNASMTTGRYGKAYDVENLRKVVELLRFPVATES